MLNFAQTFRYAIVPVGLRLCARVSETWAAMQTNWVHALSYPHRTKVESSHGSSASPVFPHPEARQSTADSNIKNLETRRDRLDRKAPNEA